MTLETFAEKAREAGEALGKQMWEMLTGALSEAAQETGNELKIKRGSLKQEDILRMLEMVQSRFDEHGNAAQQLICGSEFAEELRNHEAEWSEDEAFQAKLQELKNRKRAQFNEREARRRLVD